MIMTKLMLMMMTTIIIPYHQCYLNRTENHFIFDTLKK